MTDFDSPWKDVVNHHLPAVLELLCPEVHADIDWRRDFESLEQEFRKLSPDADTGKLIADKVIKFRSHSGDDRYLLVEVQVQPQDDFARRVYHYHYRGDDRFGVPPEAIVILADDYPDWRPSQYTVQLKRTRVTFEFDPIKVLDWAAREQELRDHHNPFALFLLAHLYALRSRSDPEQRARWKLELILLLNGRKLDAAEMDRWYAYLDYLLNLPEEYERVLWQEIQRQAQEKHMPFVTFAERYGREQGIIEGKREGLLEGLRVAMRVKFGAAGVALLPRVESIEQVDRLEAILAAVETATSAEDVARLLS